MGTCAPRSCLLVRKLCLSAWPCESSPGNPEAQVSLCCPAGPAITGLAGKACTPRGQHYLHPSHFSQLALNQSGRRLILDLVHGVIAPVSAMSVIPSYLRPFEDSMAMTADEDSADVQSHDESGDRGDLEGDRTILQESANGLNESGGSEAARDEIRSGDPSTRSPSGECASRRMAARSQKMLIAMRSFR